MKLKTENIKISKIIYMMSFISIFSAIFIALCGYVSMNKIGSNLDDIYSDQLIPLTKLSTIRENFIEIRVHMSKAQIKYSPEHFLNSQKCNSIIEENYNKYLSSNCDNFEIENLKKFKESYSSYFELCRKLDDNLKANKKPSAAEIDELTKLGKDIQDDLEKIEQYDIKLANTEKQTSDNTIKKSTTLLIIVILLCIFILSIVSYTVTKIIKHYLDEMKEYLVKVADGDLTVEIKSIGKNEFEEMKRYFKKAIDSFQLIVKGIKDKSNLIEKSSKNLHNISEEMACSSENVSTAIQDVAKGTGSQAEDLMSITSILGDFGNSLNNMVQAIENINFTSKSIESTANNSNDKMINLTKSVNDIDIYFKTFQDKISTLENSVEKISNITSFINSIAEQTNLLALNAAIEAARAGESGRGFAVVAEEIRKLAEQSKESSQNINDLISEISKDTNNIIIATEQVDGELKNSNVVINDAVESFKEIIDNIQKIIPQIDSISSSALDINKEKDTIFEKIETSSSIAEEVSASSEEIAASSEEMNEGTNQIVDTADSLNTLTKEMQESIDRFKVSDN